jgi:DNA-binding NarL/FixJ family response regulator
MSGIRMLLGDGHRAFAEALGMRLDVETGVSVVGVVSEPDDVVRVARAHPVDVALLAADGAGGDFLVAGGQLRGVCPEVKLVGVSESDDIPTLVRAVRQGFRAWVSKDVGIGTLLDVVTGVCRGESRVPPLLLTPLLDDLVREREERLAARTPLSALTEREHQVLRAMVRGASRQEVCAELGISHNTVRTHTQHILAKLGAHTSLAAVAIARRAGVG